MNRKTIPLDIEHLQEFGADVVTIKSNQNKYFIGCRQFETPELRLLVDAVESSKFITVKKSQVLIKKLSSLVSENQAKFFDNHLFVTNRIKPENEEIYYIVDIINNAKYQQKQIAFKYFEYNRQGKKQQKHKGYEYRLSPYWLVWNNDHYYVLGYSEKHGKVATFRVDRILKPRLLEEKIVPCPKEFRIEEYCAQAFKMYDGDMETVEFKCANNMMTIMVDQFGEGIKTEIIDDDYFKATAEVAVSPMFYGWLFQFVDRMTVTSPSYVVDKYREIAENAIKNI